MCDSIILRLKDVFKTSHVAQSRVGTPAFEVHREFK